MDTNARAKFPQSLLSVSIQHRPLMMEGVHSPRGTPPSPVACEQSRGSAEEAIKLAEEKLSKPRHFEAGLDDGHSLLHEARWLPAPCIHPGMLLRLGVQAATCAGPLSLPLNYCAMVWGSTQGG